MSHSVPDKEALASVWEAVKNRSIPLKPLTKAEYEVLDETQKNADIAYLVKKPGESITLDFILSNFVTKDQLNEAINGAIEGVY